MGFDYFYGISGSLDMAPYVYVENDRPTALPDRITENTGMKFWRKGPTASDFDHEQTMPNFVNRAVTYIHEKSQSGRPFYLYLRCRLPYSILPIKEYQGKSGLNPYGDFVLMVDDMVEKVMKALKDAVWKTIRSWCSARTTDVVPKPSLMNFRRKDIFPAYIYRGHKADLFDGGHHTLYTQLVRWPARIKHHVVNQTVCLTDFYATFLQLPIISCRLEERFGRGR